jgi:ribosomal protein S18 acetylase RimI-like enzyme
VPTTWRATPGEAATAANLLVEFRDWWGRSLPPAERFQRDVERLILDPGTEYLLAAGTPGDDAAGVCQLRFRYGIWHAAEDCLLEDLYVRADARRTGLGDALVEAALARARERGCARVELDVNEANPAALALYERHGFGAWSDPPGGHNLLMRRAL